MRIYDQLDGGSDFSVFRILITPEKWNWTLIAFPKTNSVGPLNIGDFRKKKAVFQPSIFGCELLVSRRVCQFPGGYTPGQKTSQSCLIRQYVCFRVQMLATNSQTLKGWA